jgi:hypothetical protein
MRIAWIIVVFVIVYCFGFRVSCFEFTASSFHLTSLPSKYSIGGMGPVATAIST